MLPNQLHNAYSAARLTEHCSEPNLIHGDTHRYRLDHPLLEPATQKPGERFTRIESFGSPSVDWVRVSVDPADPKLLAIKTGREINPAR